MTILVITPLQTHEVLMKTLLRKLLGPNKRELQAKLQDALALAESRRVKAEEGDRLLCREIDNLNDELDGLNHQFAPIKFENDRLVGENAALNSHLESGQRYTKLLADEKERLRLDAVELRENIERLNDKLADTEALLADRNGRCKQSNEVIEGLIAERDRLARMLTEPEFLKAEARKEGERIIADASMRHWSAKLMVMSFHQSLVTAENCVELGIGDEEFGHFIVTVQRRVGKSPLQLLDEAKKRNDALAHALIGLTTAVSDMRSGKSILTRGYLDMLTGRLDRAIAEADSVLASEQSAA